jgi:signal transduction histidine kinase
MSVRTPIQSAPERTRHTVDALAPLGSVLQEQDSRRVDLAHRLHRDVAGGLVACATMSEMIRHELRNGEGNAALAGMLTNLEAALRQTIKVVRDLTGEQLPSVLKTFGIGGALQQVAESPDSNIQLTITGEEPSLPLSQRLCLHQILQALLHRIHQHSGAARVEVICLFDPARMEFLIEHGGTDVMRPLSVEDAGLAAIRGRIGLLGGRLLLSRSAGESPRRVRLVVPLPIPTGDIPPPTPQPATLP